MQQVKTWRGNEHPSCEPAAAECLRKKFVLRSYVARLDALLYNNVYYYAVTYLTTYHCGSFVVRLCFVLAWESYADMSPVV